MQGAVIVNVRSGPDDCHDEIVSAFAGHALTTGDGRRLSEQVHDALGDGCEFVAVAGGDGTIRTAAQELAGSGVPLLPVPSGTRNHFARQLGIATVDDAAAAAGGGRVIEVDVAEVNGHVFVNNSSIGFYPWLVRFRQSELSHHPKTWGSLKAAWFQLRKGRKLWVTVDGTRHRAWMVWIGNGAYGRNLTGLAERESLHDGLLDVRILLAGGKLSRLKVVAALVMNRLERSPSVILDEREDVTFDVPGGAVAVALDGEVRMIEAPLRYRVRPGALRVLVPATEADG